MPINTNEKFLRAFEKYTDYYVLIGGTATSIILDVNGLKSRTTKDYDMVLIEKRKDEEFYEVLVKFLIDGNYQPSPLDEKGHLYRFTTNNQEFPKMIELFSIKPNWKLNVDTRKVPVSFADEKSLSALLLDDEYYDLLCNGREIVNGYSVLNNVTLIVFKAKAWLDLYGRREEGEKIDSSNIKKHLNDIARLTGTLTGKENIHLTFKIKEDMDTFLIKLNDNIELIPQNKDMVLNRREILDLLKNLLRT